MTTDPNPMAADRTFYGATDSKFPRTYREEVEMVFSGLDCALVHEQAVYCSSELTTGARLYAALREHQLKTRAELRERMGQAWFQANLWEPNVNAAMEFAESVRRELGGGAMVITPAPFEAPGWNQPEYWAFWEKLLRTRIKAAWFNRNWQFSNGCAFEFAVARDAGLPTLDHEGQALDIRTGIELVKEAVDKLDAQGFDTSKLSKSLDLLLEVAHKPHKDLLTESRRRSV